MIIFSSVEDTRRFIYKHLSMHVCALHDISLFIYTVYQCTSQMCRSVHHLDKQDRCAQPIQVNKRTSHPTPSFCFHSIHKRLPPARWRFQPLRETHLCYLCFGLVLRLLASFTARVPPAENQKAANDIFDVTFKVYIQM